MEYTKYAKMIFQALTEDAPANNCTVHHKQQQVILDAGIEVPGGWTSAKKLLNGLIGGRGTADFGSELIDGQRLSMVRMFLDNPVEIYQQAFIEKDGLYGVADGDGYALGFAEREDLNITAGGNLVLAGPCSLVASVFFAARPVAFALEVLYAEGVARNDIEWAWSSCPVAMLSYDQQQVALSREEMLKGCGVTGIWLRGEDSKLAMIAAKYNKGELRLHNLSTGKTWITI